MSAEPLTETAAPAQTRKQIAVLGLGNLMRVDDAVGMHALADVARDVRLPQNVQIIEGETFGLELMAPLQGVTHLLVLDAMDAGETPGTLMRFRDDAIAGMPVGSSVHLLGMTDLLGAMKLLDCAPETTVVLGIQPAIIDWGTELSPEVEKAKSRLVEEAIKQLAEWAAA